MAREHEDLNLIIL